MTKTYHTGVHLTHAAVRSLTVSAMEWSDREAAERAGAGDKEAFRLLVNRHSRALFRLAYRMTGNENDAEDLTQEALLRAFRQIRAFDGRASFATWVHRICANCALDFIRERKNRRELASAARNGERDWEELLVSGTPSPERLAQSGQVNELLEPAMRQLSERERTAFVLRHYEGYDIEQIATTLGVGGSAAKHTVFRAVQKLRRALRPALGASR